MEQRKIVHEPICTYSDFRGDKLRIEQNKGDVYYLTYFSRKNPKKCQIGIKYPGIDATPLILIGGKRAKETFDFIMQLLENHGLDYSVTQQGKQKLVKLPWATGLATAIYLLTVYSTIRPLRYASILEKIITGHMPFMKNMVTITELAVPLSNYFEDQMDHKSGPQRMVNNKAAKVVSRMLIELTSNFVDKT